MTNQLSIFDIWNFKENESATDAIGLEYKITKPIRLIELFGGIGSQAMALEYLKADFEHYRLVEYDKYPVKSYNAIHGTNFEPLDITQIKGSDLGIVDTDKYEYIMTYSFPCFTKDMMVLTKDGYKTIDQIKISDKVLSHDNKYHLVTESKKTGIKNIYHIKAMAFDEIKCTGNHKFFVRKMVRHYPTYENGKRGREREFKNPEWVECKDLTKNHYLGIAINQNSIIPKWDGVDFKWSDGRKARHSNVLSDLMNNHSFWWLIGRYIGDGWKRSQGGIIICCSKNEVHEITPHLRNCDFSYSLVEEHAINKIHIPIKELSEFVDQFGYKADGKKIPGFMFEMPINLLQSFLEGYVSADGCYTQGRYKISTVSKELAYGISQLVAKTYKVPYSLYKLKRNSVCKIENRVCNQKDSYQVVWKLNKCKQDKAFYEDGYIWFPINKIVDTKNNEEVFNITVENSHSFTVNGAIVHNCQDLSVAGKMQGMTKDSGTRSGLLWEVERLLNEVDWLPQILVMENVTQVHSSKNMPDFQKWLDFLESKGYTNHYKDMNAKNFGVAQNRNRTICVSILGGGKYTFPEEIPLKKTMKDYLEENVDKKFYITSEKAKVLIDKLIVEGKIIPQEHIRTAYMNTKKIDHLDPDNATTLCARDYKGFGGGNSCQNGVIECQKKN